MKAKQVAIEMPAGEYDVTVQSAVQFISGTQHVVLGEGSVTDLSFKDREGVWDTLFVIDVVLWCVDFFITLPSPWNWIYQLFTNGYFVLWLIYEWRIKDRYFKFQVNTANP